MKKLLFLVLVISSVAQAQIKLAPVRHIYVPVGFDNNDSVEVVVTGYFTSPCQGRNNVKIKIADENINVEITSIQRAKKSVCPQVIVPFSEVVSVGNLQAGDYVINVNGKLKEKLSVLESSSNSVDDYMYAAIDNVEKVDTQNFILHGWRYSQCMDLKQVRVVSNGKDTISVLPVMKQVTSFCPMKMTPVAYHVKLKMSELKTKEPLIHVRTADGKSFNKIIYMAD